MAQWDVLVCFHLMRPSMQPVLSLAPHHSSEYTMYVFALKSAFASLSVFL
jgi:hypothetical protein